MRPPAFYCVVWHDETHGTNISNSRTHSGPELDVFVFILETFNEAHCSAANRRERVAEYLRFSFPFFFFFLLNFSHLDCAQRVNIWVLFSTRSFVRRRKRRRSESVALFNSSQACPRDESLVHIPRGEGTRGFVVTCDARACSEFRFRSSRPRCRRTSVRDSFSFHRVARARRRETRR